MYMRFKIIYSRAAMMAAAEKYEERDLREFVKNNLAWQTVQKTFPKVL